VLFSGGTGTDSITQALLRHPQIRLRILINAYDDGLSTGRLRKFIPSMLGPSDVRKNVNRLMPRPNAASGASSFSPTTGSRWASLRRTRSVCSTPSFPAATRPCAPLGGALSAVDRRTSGLFRSLLAAFLSYFHEQESARTTSISRIAPWAIYCSPAPTSSRIAISTRP